MKQHKMPVDSLEVAKQFIVLKRKSEKIISECFSGAKELLQKEKEVFEGIICEGLSVAEWLAHCFHKVQKQKVSGEVIPAGRVTLDDLMIIFRFSSSKD